eukprot:CAMPEP_0114391436 /NCGR_PEP_ID=MMETSP0102-20121206/10098_1 /TAXON_ID=38822 ORGANISM="Pteridomonas danica, Strain PT" /NCGR_SAMPLE_ID=MMETSP0102 /ASSEMBLY_ACC=CAM_ASM_000212 /LENGTH=31 /DNA_ID= /DNA_START= /DNA_END= /DNA_ORIENTATION=
MRSCIWRHIWVNNGALWGHIGLYGASNVITM